MPARVALRLAFLITALAPLPACSPTYFKTPQLLHPGPAHYQQRNAEKYDPYPLPDLGPKIVGGRPIDYMTPVPEVERANQFRNEAAARGQPVFVPQPSVPAMPTLPAYPPTQPTIPPVEYRY